MDLIGLTSINIELTSRCNKNCWMCGRRERDKIYRDLIYGDMDFELVKKIANEVPKGIWVQLHNNGEPLLYPRFGEAVKLFKDRGIHTNIVTNGKLLIEKSTEIIGNLDTISVSIFEKDPEFSVQIGLIKDFLEKRGTDSPFLSLRFIGEINEDLYKDIDVLKIKRTLHLPKGSIGYRNPPTIPEIGVCWDFLNRLAIDRHGNVSVCVRFDPEGELRLGNIKDSSLIELWNSPKRLEMKRLHICGKRKEIPYCGNKCEFYGVPTSS